MRFIGIIRFSGRVVALRERGLRNLAADAQIKRNKDELVHLFTEAGVPQRKSPRVNVRFCK